MTKSSLRLLSFLVYWPGNWDSVQSAAENGSPGDFGLCTCYSELGVAGFCLFLFYVLQFICMGLKPAYSYLPQSGNDCSMEAMLAVSDVASLV